MNNLQIFNKDIIPVYTTDEGNKVVMGRELHEKLGIKDKYTDWMQRMIGASFIEGSDYFTLREKPKRKDGTEMPGERINHIMTLDMAKHIAMIQRNERGKQARQYFLAIEAQWNSPEVGRATQFQTGGKQAQTAKKGGIAYRRLEDVARGLGFTTVATSGNEVVNWTRVRQYLADLGVVQKCTTGDYTPESIFYRLAPIDYLQGSGVLPTP